MRFLALVLLLNGCAVQSNCGSICAELHDEDECGARFPGLSAQASQDACMESCLVHEIKEVAPIADCVERETCDSQWAVCNVALLYDI